MGAGGKAHAERRQIDLPHLGRRPVEPRAPAGIESLAHDQQALARQVGATVSGTIAVTNSKAAGGLVKGDLRLKNIALEGLYPGDVKLRFDLNPLRLKVDKLEIPIARGAVMGVLPAGCAGSGAHRAGANRDRRRTPA